ncbi:MAG: VOC family protein [Alphaproteobacteria bacterium]
MARGIDHLVLPVHDLEQVVQRYTGLGFTVTPRAVHPFGTANALVQFQGCFLELLEVDDADKIPASGSPPSFAEFNRDFLKTEQGFSMLVLEGEEGQGEIFTQAGLAARPPFYFEREARGPDGAARPVAFTLCFVDHSKAPMAGFFTCQHHIPENFWWPQYQTHANGATSIAQVALTTPTPGETVAFLEKFAGAKASGAGPEFSIDTGRGVIRVRDQASLPNPALTGAGPRLTAFTVQGVDLAGMANRARAMDLDFEETAGGLVFADPVMYGVDVTMQA